MHSHSCYGDPESWQTLKKYATQVFDYMRKHMLLLTHQFEHFETRLDDGFSTQSYAHVFHSHILVELDKPSRCVYIFPFGKQSDNVIQRTSVNKLM